MPPAKKPARKAQVKVKDLKAKKNPKGGGKSVKIHFLERGAINGGTTGKKVKIDF